MPTEPPLVHRSPRLLQPLPSDEVELPSPPSQPHQPQVQLLSILLSLLPGLLGAGLAWVIARRSPGYLLYSLPVLVAGAGVQLVLFWFQRRRYRQALQERERRFRERLGQEVHGLQQRAQLQREILLEQDPAPMDCIARAVNLDAHLWERSPADADFLALRLGTGEIPTSFSVRPPRFAAMGEGDPLLQEAAPIVDRFRMIPGAPVSLPLASIPAAGLAGPRPLLLSALRSLLVQAATHHAPDELVMAGLFPEAEAADWAPLRWLPHTWSEDRSCRLLAATEEGARDLLTRLQEILQHRRGEEGTLPRFLLIIGDGRLASDHPVWPMLLQEGASLGVRLLYLADRRESLPAQVTAIAVYGADGRSELLRTQPYLTRTSFHPDQLEAEPFERLTRTLAPLRLAGARAGTVPRRVELLELFGVGRLEHWDLAGTWVASRPWESLAVPIGRGQGGAPVILDLHERADGPHGLAAGATGSGKSELLQTLIAGLALRFHPHELAFVLVDYKGGGMANAFAGLPHLTGVITNLEGSLARRALASLKAELKRRQRVLAAAGMTHIDGYIRLCRAEPDREPLPHLLLIVDEFAELKSEQPEFMRELVSAVRVGRSLGVHLLLATQKPAGIVDEQIWSNTRFRLCLRVERREDSVEVLKSPAAAVLSRPGLGWLQVGSGERFEQFQAGWGGAPYQPETAASVAITVAEVGLDGGRVLLTAPPPVQADGPTQLVTLVDFIRQTGLQPVKGPWLPPLPTQLALADLVPNPSEVIDPAQPLAPTIGLLDDPEGQVQRPLRLDLKEGHLLIIGAPGSGKTQLLLTLALSLAQLHAPSDLHLYLIDGAGRGLLPLAGLPHVGAVLLVDEVERLRRLARFLQGELTERKERIGRSGAGSWLAYRQLTDDPLPAIVLLVDNLSGLTSSLPDWEELLASLCREGAPFGLHVVLTAAAWNQIRSRLTQSIGLAIALQLHDRAEYPAIVGRTGGLVPAPLPGRGLIRSEPPLEFQAALPVSGSTDWERQAALQSAIQSIDARWEGSRPRPIEALPAVISLSKLIAATPSAAPIGLEIDSLAPFRLDLKEGPCFLVAGPPESGKSTLLQTALLSLAHLHPPEDLRVWLADLGGSGLGLLQSLPHVAGAASDGAGSGALIEAIATLLQERRERRTQGAATTEPPLLVIADDLDLFREALPASARDRLESIIRRDRGLGFHLLVAGGSAALQSGYDGLTKALRELQTGFLLGTADPAEGALFGVRLPHVEGNRFLAPGQGYYIRRGRVRAIKGALPVGEGEALSDWIGRLGAKGDVGDRKEGDCDPDQRTDGSAALPRSVVR
jgi:S-DNA-T family DNA segregation ATPase FtsK/SpoIIIE